MFFLGNQWDFIEDIMKVMSRLQSVGFSRFHQAVKCCTGMSSPGRITEHPIAPSDDKRPDGIFSDVIVRGQILILQIPNNLDILR